MKKLYKANWSFLFYSVSNKSESHGCKLAHYPAKTQDDNCRTTDLSKMMMSAFILEWYKMLLISDSNKTVINISYYYHQGSIKRHMDQESKYCGNEISCDVIKTDFLFTHISIENSQFWCILMMFNHLKTISTKFTHNMPKIRKVIEFFTFSPWCNAKQNIVWSSS